MVIGTLLFINILLINSVQSQNNITQITIYMESLCPYCIQFITTSLKEFYTKVNKPNLANIEMIPYGNAKESYDATTKKYSFTCQHGDNECYGNLILSCSLNVMGKIEGQFNIICLLENIFSFNKDFDLALEYCLSSNQKVLQEIKECVKSDIGNIYQHQMAQKTGEHLGVPWILVNGVFDDDTETQIRNSLIEYICGEDESKCF